jgi:hypothetical protein
MMQMQAQQHQQNMQMLTAAMSQPKSNTMKEIATVLAPFIPLAVKLIEGRAADSSLKAIETIAKVKDLFGGDGGGNDNGDILSQLAKQFGPVIAAKLAMGGQTAPQVDAPQNVVALPAGEPAQAGSEPLAGGVAPLTTDDPAMIKQLVIRAMRNYYPMLAKMAAKEKDPQTYFSLVMDEMEEQPPAVIRTFIELLQQDDWAAVVFGQDPLPFAKWFGELRQEFLNWAKEQEDNETFEKNKVVLASGPEPVKESAKK